jgi:hypothetical protein
MGRGVRPHVTLNCQADRYAGPTERIVEFTSRAGGGLVSFMEKGDRLSVHVYGQDATVDVSAGRAVETPDEGSEK